MGWERGYYYRVRRVDGHVVREYIGTGPKASAAAAADRAAGSERRRAREEAAADEAEMAEISEACELVLAAALLCSGRRKHKGEWR